MIFPGKVRSLEVVKLVKDHFISPNEPRVQLSKQDKQTILDSYQVPGEVSISVGTEYDPECPVKSI